MSDAPQWEPDAPRLEYTYVALANHVVARIKAGEISPGARLAGERALAEEYGVALGTIRRAIEHLRDGGWLVTLPAKGTYVKAAEDWPQDA
ncbi:winged helix-turn-helix domain-containing protein [Nonomuraea terrae]|uniref:winged helix-turn-helix domain-containing protein n=1 Tax=Nonomuraea terrae TaxID=2530383 RepID=UPI0037B3E7F9